MSIIVLKLIPYITSIFYIQFSPHMLMLDFLSPCALPFPLLLLAPLRTKPLSPSVTSSNPSQSSFFLSPNLLNIDAFLDNLEFCLCSFFQYSSPSRGLYAGGYDSLSNSFSLSFCLSKLFEKGSRS